MHPFALAASLALHAAVLVWLVVALPDFGERLASADVTTIEVVMEEADTPPQLPAEAAPLPERAPTRTAEPSPPAAQPTPEPPGTPAPPRADAPPAPDAEPAAEPEPAPEPEPEPVETAATDPAPDPPAAPPETAPAPAPEEAPAPEPAPSEPATAEPEASEPGAEDAPAAEPAPRMAAIAEPPQRRPPRPEPEPEPQPTESAADATDATDATDGAPQPDADTRREEPPAPDEVDALLQSVEELARRVEAEEPREGTGDAEVDSPTGRLADLRAQRLGRLIYEQIVGCWNPPAGLDGLREVGPVEIRAEFRQNGEVVSAEVTDQGRLATERVFRSVAESARRAVFNCAPLEGMPSEFYSQWRVVILEFRPDQIAAGG